MVARKAKDDKIGCHMNAALPALIFSDRTFQPRTHAMEQCELERELERLHPESWGWALACCARDQELAEDVLQSAYLAVLSGGARFKGGSTVKTWIFGVIRWTARTERRRRLIWIKRTASSENGLDLADHTDGADSAAGALTPPRGLISAPASLSRRERGTLSPVFFCALAAPQRAAGSK